MLCRGRRSVWKQTHIFIGCDPFQHLWYNCNLVVSSKMHRGLSNNDDIEKLRHLHYDKIFINLPSNNYRITRYCYITIPIFELCTLDIFLKQTAFSLVWNVAVCCFTICTLAHSCFTVCVIQRPFGL